jgi:SAM-dependent methyltransferase
MQKLWNERYSAIDFAYGTKPNEYFKSEIDKLNPGKLLLIGEGEGRNAIYAAKLGWKVDAVDFSEAGKAKALNLAKENNVDINYITKDLKEFEPRENYYNVVGIIYIHLEESLRKVVHRNVIKSLAKDGKVIIEVFEKEQIKYKSGGPKELDLLYSLEDIVTDFIDLDFLLLNKEIIELNEGKYHLGEAVVIRFTGMKIQP